MAYENKKAGIFGVEILMKVDCGFFEIREVDIG